MQQRQLRLGDILDDYCTRERRVTNHAIVAMVGSDVKQTRCTTCDTEHEYKHAKVPRQRRKAATPAALHSQVANGPKRVGHEEPSETDVAVPAPSEGTHETAMHAHDAENGPTEEGTLPPEHEPEEGPVHRPLIRATLPRPEGQVPPGRPVPEFTIRQPSGRQNRFRAGRGRGGQFHGTRPGGGTMGGHGRGGMARQGSGRPHQGSMTSHSARRPGHGQKRPK